MIKGLMMNVGGFGGDIGGILADWEALGVFAYALPFLLIFAVVFGVLSQTKIFKENKSINGIIALVVALMALQFDFVPTFFAEIFPRVGVGLVLILVALILLGLFMGPKLGSGVMTGLGAIIFLVILFQSFGDFGTSGGDFLLDRWSDLLIGALVVGAVIAIIVSMGGKKEKGPADDSILSRALSGK